MINVYFLVMTVISGLVRADRIQADQTVTPILTDDAWLWSVRTRHSSYTAD